MIAHGYNSIETRRLAVQEAIDASRSAKEKNRLGQFATPNSLALEIARYVTSLPECKRDAVRFADPAVGSGSFFSAARAVLGKKAISSAIGVEIDPAFCAAARDLWEDEGLEVVRSDFTKIVDTSDCPASPNLILANPPYVRHHHLDRAEKERLQALTHKMTGVDVNGLAGLYVYFLLLATAWMEEGGIAAWLIPSEFMDVNYGACLRAYLVNNVALHRIHRFDPENIQFGDAEVSSVIVIFRKTLPAPDHRIKFSFGGTLCNPQVIDPISPETLRESRKWTSFPHHAKNDRRTSGDRDQPVLADYFRIQRGVATGGNKFFIIKRSVAELQHFPERYLRPILPSPRHLKETVIERDGNGYPVVEPQLCLIDCDLPEHVLRLRHPSLWNYLQTAESLGIMEGYLIGKRNPWYKQENRKPAPFLCTYMGRGSNEKRPFRFIWNRSEAIGTNLYLMLYPRDGMATMLRRFPDHEADLFALLGEVTGHELRGEGRVYGGGLNKIEPSELGRISAAGIVDRWPELAGCLRQRATPGLFD